MIKFGPKTQLTSILDNLGRPTTLPVSRPSSTAIGSPKTHGADSNPKCSRWRPTTNMPDDVKKDG